jgi:hypothetical protein
MEEPKRDGSMYIRMAVGQQLISSATAVAICRMVVIDWEGEEECRWQEPLIAEEDSNVWNIRGSLLMKPDAIPGDPVPVRMSISKFDGAIVSLTGSAPRVAAGPPA